MTDREIDRHLPDTWTTPKPAVRGRGRPMKHGTEAEKRAANAEAARRYRAKKAAARDARRVADRNAEARAELERSTVIDLSAIPYSRRREARPMFTLYVYRTPSGETSGQIYRDGTPVAGIGGCTDRNEVIDWATAETAGAELEILAERPPTGTSATAMPPTP